MPTAQGQGSQGAPESLGMYLDKRLWHARCLGRRFQTSLPGSDWRSCYSCFNGCPDCPSLNCARLSADDGESSGRIGPNGVRRASALAQKPDGRGASHWAVGTSKRCEATFREPNRGALSRIKWNRSLWQKILPAYENALSTVVAGPLVR